MNKEELVTTPFKKSGQFLARSAERLGQLGGLVVRESPFGVPTEETDPQEIIKHFKGRFAVATDVIEVDDPEVQRDRVAFTAHSMVDEGVVNEQTEVAIHPLAPEDALRDDEFTESSLAVMGLFSEAFSKYGVHAMPNSLPVMPTKHEDSPVDPRIVWGSIGGVMDGLEHQMSTDSDREAALLMIAPKLYARRLLSGQVHFEDSDLDDSPILVMQRTGKSPHENLLLPAHPAKLLEAGEPTPKLL